MNQYFKIFDTNKLKFIFFMFIYMYFIVIYNQVYLQTNLYFQSPNFLTIIFPLLGFLHISLFGRFFGIFGAPLIGILCIFISWLSCISWLFNGFFYINLGLWFSIDTLNIYWSFNFGSLSWIMCLVVTTVSLVVHLFSYFYMIKDPHIVRFFSYLNLFTFFMLFLIVSDNLILIFWGWEGVGICSYLLINFWYNRILANKSALKAVFVNKVSDIFFLYGIILVVLELNTTELTVFFSLIPFIHYKYIIIMGYKINLLNLISIFFMLGAFGKSAQIGLHIWLPEAMEGPTPVSALIHAATMVTAGVFLIIRFSVLFESCPLILKIILFVGSFTALLSSIIGSFQYDVKKIIAYSTCSQLGYMFLGCGFSNYNLALFHLFNHAFFKALLFLSSGLIIHSLNTQDIRLFSSEKVNNSLLITLFTIPSLALSGLPFYSGSFSKELIIIFSSSSYIVDGEFLYFFLILSACMTLFYSIKLICFIYSKNKIYKKKFILKNNVNNIENFFLKKKKYHLIYVYIPLIFLMVLSILSGFLFKDVFIGLNSDFFIRDIFINSIQEQRFIESNLEISFFFKKYLPFLLSILFFFIFEFLNYIFKNKIRVYYFFKLKLYFDFFYNFFLLQFKKISFVSFFRNLDNGILLLLGPNGFIKHVFWMVLYIRYFEISLLYNYVCLFLFFLTYTLYFI